MAEINAAMKLAAEGPLKGILCYTEDPIAIERHHRRPHTSSIFSCRLHPRPWGQGQVGEGGLDGTTTNGL